MTVVAMTRSLLKEKGMPSMFWGEAVRHSVYILNRVPTRVLQGETPYEAWKGEKPNIGFLRVFGCLAHMKVPKEHIQKLDDRSKKMVYLGKEPGSKAHRLFDPLKGRLSVSIDVIFEEDRGWSWENQDVEKEKSGGSFVIVDTHEPVHKMMRQVLPLLSNHEHRSRVKSMSVVWESPQRIVAVQNQEGSD